MPKAEVTRLTIVWSKETDAALRSYLGSRGLKKGALSKFVEDAVRWRLLDKTISQVRKTFSNVPANELDGMIEEAFSSVRQRNRPQRKRSR